MAVSHFTVDVAGKLWANFDKPNHKGLKRAGAKQAVCESCGRVFLHRTDEKRRVCKRGCVSRLVEGRRSPTWRGGRRVADGYVTVCVPVDHPMRNKSGYAREHRLVMAEHLGRPLEEWEQVHHINGDRCDNRLENLELRASHGSGQAYCCADCGSRRVLPVPLAA